MVDIVLTTNSPGEVASWVKPVVRRLNELNIEKNIYVFTPPCVFSSGNEGKVLSKLEGITAAFNSRQYLKYILLNIKPDNFKPSKDGFVFFLGGDFMHAVFLGKRLDYPVYAYTERDYGFPKSIKKYYLSDQNLYNKMKKDGIDEDKLKIVGNLMFDSINPQLTQKATAKLLNKKEGETLINLFPGSRPKEFSYLLPLYLNFISEINKKENNYRFIISKAAFINERDIEMVIRDERIKEQVTYEPEKNTIILNGCKIKIYEENLQSIMRESDFAVTIPGTNNLELAVLDTPMLVILPLNKPELIPLPGIIGLIGELPIIGKIIKKSISSKVLKKREYFSLVNILSQKEIVPSLVGEMDSKQLSQVVTELLREEKFNELKAKIKSFEGQKNAVNKIVEDILKDLGNVNI
ncbi:MAG TPA: hypothetical protein VKN64_09970 [Halanaerobiales bacterium]|nr:hypothetical protein [Halanaerobiales bacterium]